LSGLTRRAGLALALLAGGCSPERIANAFTPNGDSVLRSGLAYGPLPRHRLDLTLPAHAGPATPLVVFFYGGGWRSGERGTYGFLARTLAAQGFAVAVPDYRLFPEVRWPDFLEDSARAVAWLRAAPVVPKGPLFLMGHSAGGYIAAALALDPRWLESAGFAGGQSSLAGGILLAAPISWQPADEPSRTIFAPAPGGRIEAAPDPSTLRGAPPMLLLHSLADTTVYPVHAERLAVGLRAAGRSVRLRLYEGVGHIGIIAALAAPVRSLGLAGAPVFEEVVGFVRNPAAQASAG